MKDQKLAACTLQERLKIWLETQYGTAGWETKLENFILKETKLTSFQIICKIKETGKMFNPDVINFFAQEVIVDISMDDIVGSIKYSFDEIEMYVITK